MLKVNAEILQCAGGWAHFVAVTDTGHVCTWGWRGCAPTLCLRAVQADGVVAASSYNENDSTTVRSPPVDDSESFDSTPSMPFLSKTGVSLGGHCGRLDQSGSSNFGPSSSSYQSSMNKHMGTKSPIKNESLKSTELLFVDAASTEGTAIDGNVVASLDLVLVGPGVVIISVAAGGRHTLALSDAGKVWGWGYGGEGQLGLGSRIHVLSTPHLIGCLDAPHWTSHGSVIGVASVPSLPSEVCGTHITSIACGGRHSAVLTDTGAVLTFGWGLYGQCGQGSTEDQLIPGYVSAFGGIKVTGLAAGLWHTMFITDTGDVYATGGNQFGQLGIGGDQAEMLPSFIAADVLENEVAIVVSCGARHTAVLTEKGNVFSWGWNKYGQLGVGDILNRDTPGRVPLGNAVARSVACGWWHSLALVEEDLP